MSVNFRAAVPICTFVAAEAKLLTLVRGVFMKTRFSCLAALLLAACLLSGLAVAQEIYATLIGTVTDPTRRGGARRRRNSPQ